MSGNSLKDMLREEGAAKRFTDELRPTEETEVIQGFSFGRVGQRPQLMLTFVKCDGHHLVLPYADLRSITTNEPDKGFLMEFVGREVLVEGTSLMICFRYLRDQRLAELVECNLSSVMAAEPDAPVVQKITIRKPRANNGKPAE